MTMEISNGPDENWDLKLPPSLKRELDILDNGYMTGEQLAASFVDFLLSVCAVVCLPGPSNAYPQPCSFSITLQSMEAPFPRGKRPCERDWFRRPSSLYRAIKGHQSQITHP